MNALKLKRSGNDGKNQTYIDIAGNPKEAIETVKTYIKQGYKNAGAIAKAMGVSTSQLSYVLKKENIKFIPFRREILDLPQNKAWVTIKKNEAIDSYKSATSAGLKAGIARKFKQTYGIDIKTVLEPVTPIAPKVKKVKPVTTKIAFSEKVAQLQMPYPVKQLFDSLIKRIEVLESKK